MTKYTFILIAIAILCVPATGNSKNIFGRVIENAESLKKAKKEQKKTKKLAYEKKQAEVDEASPAEEMAGYYPMLDTEFEWSQYEDKEAKVLITDGGLEIDSRTDKKIVYSTVELPVDTENDSFTFGVPFISTKKIEDKRYIGLLFDYEDERNFKGFSVSKNQFVYFTCTQGVTSVVKRGLIKIDDKTNNLWMQKEGDRITFGIDNQEITKVNRINVENAVFGAMIEGKFRVLCPGFIFQSLDPQDSEQSTTD